MSDSFRITYSPWGYPQIISTIIDGIHLIETAGHGGLHLSDERWQQLPLEVRDTMLTPKWAEEDCEAYIILAVFGIANVHDREFAIQTTKRFNQYAACLPFI